MVESQTGVGRAFPRGILREATPLALFGGDTLIYRAILLLGLGALPVVAGVNWVMRGALPWAQLGMTAALAAGGFACLEIARRGWREIAAVLLIGFLWISVTIYAFATGYGIHSAMVFIYLPCLLYTVLFFGVYMASAELVLTIAVLTLMYVAEANGRLRGAAGLMADGMQFNHYLGVVVTCVGMLVGALVYHRRVEREAARVVEEAGKRRTAMEQAQQDLAQAETARARADARATELEARLASSSLEIESVGRGLRFLKEALARGLPGDVLANLADCAMRPLQLQALDMTALARRAADQVRAAGIRATVTVDPGMRARADVELVSRLLLALIRRGCAAGAGGAVHVGSGSLEGRTVFFVSSDGTVADAERDPAIAYARCAAERHGGELAIQSAAETRIFFSLSS